MAVQISRTAGHVDLALKQAIAKGLVHGPCIYSASEALVISGGIATQGGNLSQALMTR